MKVIVIAALVAAAVAAPQQTSWSGRTAPRQRAEWPIPTVKTPVTTFFEIKTPYTEFEQGKLPKTKIPEVKTPEVHISEVIIPEQKFAGAKFQYSEVPEVVIPRVVIPQVNISSWTNPEMEFGGGADGLLAPADLRDLNSDVVIDTVLDVLPQINELIDNFPGADARFDEKTINRMVSTILPISKSFVENAAKARGRKVPDEQLKGLEAMEKLIPSVVEFVSRIANPGQSRRKSNQWQSGQWQGN